MEYEAEINEHNDAEELSPYEINEKTDVVTSVKQFFIGYAIYEKKIKKLNCSECVLQIKKLETVLANSQKHF